MAYKITKYRGKHTIKDTKTGKSQEIDIEELFADGGKKDKDKNISLPSEENRKIAYANAKGLDNTQLGGFEDQDMSDENWRANRDSYYSKYFQDWRSQGANSKFSQTAPEYMQMKKDMQESWFVQNQRPINDIVLDYRTNGPANPSEPMQIYDGNFIAPTQNRVVGMAYGGKMSVPKYAYGDAECPPGDIQCEELKKMAQFQYQSNFQPLSNGAPQLPNNRTDYGLGPSIQNKEYGLGPTMVGGYAPQTDSTGIVTEQTQQGNNIPTEEELTMEDMRNRTAQNIAFGKTLPKNTAPETGKSFDDILSEGATQGRERAYGEENYNMFNPYAGVDIPTAAYTLGQSIENKDALGIVGSGLKVGLGLGRNLVSGMGYQNRYNQVMGDANRKLKKNRNMPTYLGYGGKRDEEIATGEYMRGVENEEASEYNAEIEKGEYFQTNQGDIAEVIGNKHTSEGEKVNMEAEDRVLSDQLELGGATAKMLAEKYDLKLKAKNTYSDVLDKFRKKMKLDKMIDNEAEILKKIDGQREVTDTTTRDFNLMVLAEKKKEIEMEKHPIEEMRKGVFEELYNIQEDSKPKDKSKPVDEFAEGGKMHSLANQYGISPERAKELIKEYSNGGEREKYVIEQLRRLGYKGDINEKNFEQKIGEAQAFMAENMPQEVINYFNTKDSNVTVTAKGIDELKKTNPELLTKLGYDLKTPSAKYTEEERKKIKDDLIDSGEATDDFWLSQFKDNKWDYRFPLVGMDRGVAGGIKADYSITATAPLSGKQYVPNNGTLPVDGNGFVDEGRRDRRNGNIGGILFPDESPLPPTGLQGTIKPEARFDRVSPNKIAIEPYLQSIQNRRSTQNQRYEGFSPSVAAAMKQNEDAILADEELKTRNTIDTQNLSSAEKAEYTNAQLQRQEQTQNINYRQGYESRIYRAQALSDNDLNEYYNQLQRINTNRFKQIEDLNLVNATNEDIAYIPGRGYVRKNTDQELFSKWKRENGYT